ncbi:MAG: hypothetical protein ACYTHN_23480 [Planctomycetota bacterium]
MRERYHAGQFCNDQSRGRLSAKALAGLNPAAAGQPAVWLCERKWKGKCEQLER